MNFTEFPDEDDEIRVRKLKKRPSCLLGFFRLFLVLLIPVFIVATLLPTLLSSDPAREWALKEINAVIAPAQLSVDQWSLGWFSAPVLGKIGYTDAARGVDLKADEVTFDRGLLRLLPIGVLDLGCVTLKNPETVVSLIPPPEPEEANAHEKTDKKGFFFLPIVDVAIVLNVENGRAQVVGNAPRPFEAQQVNGSLVLESYRKPIGVQTQMRVGDGTLTIEGRVQSLKDLFKGEALEQPQTLTLKLVGVDLTAFCPLIEHASGEPWICSGTAEGALTAVVSSLDQFKVDGGLIASGLSVAAANQKPSPKGDLALMINVGYDKQVIAVNKFELSSPWLRATASGTLQQDAKAGAMIGSISVKADSDLAAVARDFAPALGLSNGFRMQKGRLQADVVLAGSETAMNVDAKLTTSDLSMTIDDAPLILKPAPSLVFKAKFPYGQWPEVETFHLKAPFADIYGSGPFDSAVVKGKIDLTRFSRDFKQMLKNAPPMVGSVYLDLATRRDNERVKLNTFLKLSEVAAELKPGQRMVVPQGTLKIEGYVPLKENRPENEIQDASFEFTLENGNLSGGWKRLTFPAEAHPLVLRGFTLTSSMELNSVRRLLGGALSAAAQRHMTEWQGHVIANATAEAAGGVLKVRVNSVGQEILAGVDGGLWRIPDIRMEGALTQASPQDGIQIEATLTGCGALERDGAQVFAEKNARLIVDALFAPDGNRIQVSNLDITSSLFDLQTQADVSELATRCVVDAKGNVSVNFDAVSELLDTKGIDAFKLTGRGQRAFHLVGPLAGGTTTLFAEGELTGSLFLGSLTGLGLNAGASDITLHLAKGLLKTAYQPALNGGKLRLVTEMTMEHGITTLGFPAQTRLLENVKLNQEMASQLLVRVNPLFEGSVVQDGAVTVDILSGHLSSGLPLDKGINAEADILFTNLRLELGSSLHDLLTLLKVNGQTYSEEHLSVHVVIKDGRINVAPIKMVIDKQPVIFSGWVAFDGTIKYLIEVPLTDRATGGKGGKLLKGMTIKIPVTGTVSNPRLDTSVLQNALGNLLKNAVGEHAVEKIGTFLEKLQEELRK